MAALNAFATARPGPHDGPVRPLVLAALLLYTLLAGATFLVARVAVLEFEPLALAGLRFALASAALVGLVAVREARAGRPAFAALVPPKGHRMRIAVLGIFGTTLNQALFLVGMRHTTPPHASLLYAATPVLVLAIAVARGEERIVPTRALGIAVALAGVAWLLFGRDPQATRGDATLLGDALVACAVVAWALYTAGHRRVLAHVDPLAFTAQATLAGTLVFVPIGVPAVLAQDWSHVTARGWFGLGYIALVTSVASYLLWSWALARTEASRVAVFTNLQPVVAAGLAWLVLGTPLTLHFGVAAAVVLAGIALAERR